MLPQNKFEAFATSEEKVWGSHLSHSLMAKALGDAAEALEAEARQLRRRAYEFERNANRELSWQSTRKQIRAAAIRASRGNRPFAEAAHEIARYTQAPLLSVVQVMQEEVRKTSRETRYLRNEEIMRLKRQGLTNAEIGRRMGLHEKSVARISGQMRRYMVFWGPK